MNFWERIDGLKSVIGVAAFALLQLVVDWDKTDALTWDTGWVLIAVAGITTWTGVAVRHALSKIGK